MNRFSLLIAIPMVSLLGCQYVPAKDVSSPYYAPPVGSVLSLQQDLQIEPGWARVFVQGGRALLRNEVDEWSAHCNVEVDKVATVGGEPQYILADEFRIDKVGRRINRVNSGRIVVASLIFPGREDGGYSFTTLTTEMRLHSTSQPHVRKLICAQVWGAYGQYARHLSIEKIRTVLAGIATLALAE